MLIQEYPILSSDLEYRDLDNIEFYVMYFLRKYIHIFYWKQKSNHVLSIFKTTGMSGWVGATSYACYNFEFISITVSEFSFLYFPGCKEITNELYNESQRNHTVEVVAGCGRLEMVVLEGARRCEQDSQVGAFLYKFKLGP